MQDLRSSLFKRLKIVILNILSGNRVWKRKSIIDKVNENNNKGDVNIRIDDFPCGAERLPRYVSAALKELKAEGKVINVSRGYWRKFNYVHEKN